MEKRKDVKFAFAEPDENRRVVSMVEFQGRVFVATQKGVYELKDNTLVRLEFVDNTPLRAPLQAPESPVEA